MSTPLYWQSYQNRLTLTGEICENCKSKLFPPRDVCPHCADEAGPAFQFSGKGEVYSYTTIYNAPEGFKSQVPYTVALVKLEEGPMLTTQLTDVDRGDVKIGDKVEMVTRKLAEQGEKGVILYGYKFRPRISQMQELL